MQMLNYLTKIILTLPGLFSVWKYCFDLESPVFVFGQNFVNALLLSLYEVGLDQPKANQGRGLVRAFDWCYSKVSLQRKLIKNMTYFPSYLQTQNSRGKAVQKLFSFMLVNLNGVGPLGPFSRVPSRENPWCTVFSEREGHIMNWEKA